MVVNYIAKTFAYWSTMGQNVRHIMSKYNVTHQELLYMPLSAIKYKCKEMWHISVNATYCCFLMALYHLFNVYMFVDF